LCPPTSQRLAQTAPRDVAHLSQDLGGGERPEPPRAGRRDPDWRSFAAISPLELGQAVVGAQMSRQLSRRGARARSGFFRHRSRKGADSTLLSPWRTDFVSRDDEMARELGLTIARQTVTQSYCDAGRRAPTQGATRTGEREMPAVESSLVRGMRRLAAHATFPATPPDPVHHLDSGFRSASRFWRRGGERER
jgi:hypothetical protein